MTKLDKFLLEKIGYESFEPGLERVKTFLKNDIPKIQGKIITIAGTNGKGECSFTLGQLFKRSQNSYAVWSSPHIETVSERFDFCGNLIHEDELYQKAISLLDEMNKAKIKLSYYEFLFALFIKECAAQNPEYIILEVGLGGRLDAVNVMDADIAAITSISRDHQEFLGSSLKGILKEKFMVSRSGRPLITALKSSYLRDEAKKLAGEYGVLHTDLVEKGLTQSKDYSESNRILALETYKKITDSNNLPTLIELMSFSFRGRFDRIFQGKKEIVFCGAHNLDGLRSMFSLICQKHKNEYRDFTLLASFSKRDGKDLKSMVRVVQENTCLFSKSVFTEFEHVKAAELDKNFNTINFQTDWKKIIDDEEKLFITGSYYFIGQVKNFLNVSSHSPA